MERESIDTTETLHLDEKKLSDDCSEDVTQTESQADEINEPIISRIKEEPVDIVENAYHAYDPTSSDSSAGDIIKEEQEEVNTTLCHFLAGGRIADKILKDKPEPLPVALFINELQSTGQTGLTSDIFTPPVTSLSVVEGVVNCSRSLNRMEHVGSFAPLHTKEQRYKCSICSYTLVLKTLVEEHELTHSEDISYACSRCSNTSVHEEHSESPMLPQNFETPYKCPLCPYSNMSKAKLKQHSVVHCEDKPFRCKTCPYSTARKGDLTGHEKIHTGVRPYKCPLCPYSAITQKDVKKHGIIHTGEKPYTCSMCDQKFARQSNLRKHERSHLGERPYQCSLCSYCATRKEHLTRHMLGKHEKPGCSVSK